MATTPRRTRRTSALDPGQLHLFAQVEDALRAGAHELHTEQTFTPTEPAPTRGEELRTLIATDLLTRQRGLDAARHAFGRDPDTLAAIAAAAAAHTDAEAAHGRALSAAAAAAHAGDTARAGYYEAVAAMADRSRQGARATLLQLSAWHRAQISGPAAQAQVEADLLLEQEILDHRATRVQEVRLELLDELERDRPGYLPRPALDATPAQQQAWQQRAIDIEVYRARFGVTDPEHPLGPRPVDRALSREYDRAANRLGLEPKRDLTITVTRDQQLTPGR